MIALVFHVVPPPPSPAPPEDEPRRTKRRLWRNARIALAVLAAMAMVIYANCFSVPGGGQS